MTRPPRWRKRLAGLLQTLADRLVLAPPAADRPAPVPDRSPGGRADAPSEPGAGLGPVQPPEHWLARVRQGAPGLLSADGDALRWSADPSPQRTRTPIPTSTPVPARPSPTARTSASARTPAPGRHPAPARNP